MLKALTFAMVASYTLGAITAFLAYDAINVAALPVIKTSGGTYSDEMRRQMAKEAFWITHTHKERD